MNFSKFALLAVVALAACAERSESISPFYVPTYNYQTYSCTQLKQEAARVSADAQEVAKVQDKLATNDAVLSVAALASVWSRPAVYFLTGGNADTADQLAQLRGEMVALEKQAILMGCPLTPS
ncbi:MAG: hypothetical protein QGI08_13440 [Paracoccaceae bacterium]|jgi:hypothetical protein|nr:hypothetical protein [Paracoccaceae bacterium]MDP7186721.1 hypothetical protein [Paracoccaceae bacterium]